MDLKIPNIVKPLYLREYADEFKDATIWVWVNPRREMRLQLNDILKGVASEELIGALFSEIWSQGSNDTRMTPEEVLKMADECLEQDPRLWVWLVNQTVELITEHLVAKKKPLS